MTTQLEMFAGPWNEPVACMGHGSHANSRESYHGLGAAKSERMRQVIDLLRDAAGPRTDREVMCMLGFTDPNAVRPRISEGIRAGLIRECGKRVCEWTGKTVRIVEAI